MRLNSKRLAVAAGGLALFGGVVASAASLGGLTSSNLGANNTVVASCDTDGVTISYANAYDATAGAYKVGSVTVGGIAAGCAGQVLNVTLKGSTGTSLAATSVTVSGTSETMSVSGTVLAESVTGAAVVISG
jgi:hypothetical protein